MYRYRYANYSNYHQSIYPIILNTALYVSIILPLLLSLLGLNSYFWPCVALWHFVPCMSLKPFTHDGDSAFGAVRLC